MKIEQISIKNYLGIRDFQTVLGELNLVCGLNGSGKSSVENAIRLAVTGEVSRIALKKDYALLIHEGQKQAQIKLQGEPEAVVAITAAKATGIPNPADTPAVLHLLLNMHAISSLPATELRKTLFEIGGVSGDDAKIVQQLEAEGIGKPYVAAIKPLLRNFEAAEKEAESRAKEARGEWKGITGETYGEVKAETWAAPEPEIPEIVDRSAELKAAVKVAQEAAAKRQAGAGLRASIEADLTAARERAKAYAAWADAVAASDKQIEAVNAKIEQLESVLAGGPAIKALAEVACPECGSDLRLLPGNKLVGRETYEAEAADAPPEGAKAELQQQIKARDALKRQRELEQRDLEAADTAAKQIPAFEKQLAEIAAPDPGTDDGEANEQALEDAQAALQAHLDDLWAARDAESTANAGKQKTAAAEKAHEAVKAWTKLRELMSPDGIPAQFLTGILDQINTRLRASAATTQWGQVQIHADMRITYGGRFLQLCSESEQWRADAMLCEAVAYASAECFLMFDRCDVLGPEQRGVLLGWCDQLAQEGHQVVLFSTLKGPPKADGIRVLWLDKGSIQEAA